MTNNANNEREDVWVPGGCVWGARGKCAAVADPADTCRTGPRWGHYSGPVCEGVDRAGWTGHAVPVRKGACGIHSTDGWLLQGTQYIRAGGWAVVRGALYLRVGGWAHYACRLQR